MVEGARLESVCAGNRTAGSNPALSAIYQKVMPRLQDYWNSSYKNIPEDKEPSVYAVEKEKLFPHSATVCDLGGSSGVDSLYFAKHSHHVTLLDISDLALQKARDAAKRSGMVFRIKIIESDLAEGLLPLGNSSCDVVYSRLALHYFESKTLAQLFQEIYRVLKPNGKAYITLKSPKDTEAMHYLEKTATQKEPGVFIEDGLIKTRFNAKQLAGMLSDTEITTREYTITPYIESFKGRKDKVKSGKSELLLNEVIITKMV